MDINPKRTLATVGISLLIGGGILYYQYTSYTPSAAATAKKGAENIKKMSTATDAPTSAGKDSANSLAMPEVVAPAAAAPTPLPGAGVLSSLPSFDNETLGPRMKEALQKKAGLSQPSQQSSAGRSTRPNSSGGGSGGGGGGSGGVGSNSGNNSASGTSGGGGGGTGSTEDNATGQGEYWIDSATSIRHNSACELYRTSEGRVGTKEEGTPCRICGG